MSALEYEALCKALFAQIERAVRLRVPIQAEGQSTLIVQQDVTKPDLYFAALAVRLEYAPTPEEAVDRLASGLRRSCDAAEARLQEAGSEEPEQG